MKDFLHVVATRVGIGVYDEKWFEVRLSLFESITLASMRGQSCQDFYWLLVIGKEMPPVARERLEEMVRGIDNIVLLEVELKTEFRGAVARWARKKAKEAGTEVLLSTRLDDDDALRSDAFEIIHRDMKDYLQEADGRFGLFSFNLGAMWLPSHRRAYTRYHYSIGIGLSLAERAERCITVYGKPHLDIKLVLASRAWFREYSGGEPWWLYSTHNLSDSETGEAKRVRKILTHKRGYDVDDTMLKGFGIDPAKVDELASIADARAASSLFRLSLRGTAIEQELVERRSALKATQDPREIEAITRDIERLKEKLRAAGSGLAE